MRNLSRRLNSLEFKYKAKEELEFSDTSWVTIGLVHVLFLMLACFPELILPTVFLYMFFIGLWNFRYRPGNPPRMNTRLSYADGVSPYELDEEFDTFPTTKSIELVRMWHDRLRSVAGRIQTVVGDMASQGNSQLVGSLRHHHIHSVLFGGCHCVVCDTFPGLHSSGWILHHEAP